MPCRQTFHLTGGHTSWFLHSPTDLLCASVSRHSMLLRWSLLVVWVNYVQVRDQRPLVGARQILLHTGGSCGRLPCSFGAFLTPFSFPKMEDLLVTWGTIICCRHLLWISSLEIEIGSHLGPQVSPSILPDSDGPPRPTVVTTTLMTAGMLPHRWRREGRLQGRRHGAYGRADVLQQFLYVGRSGATETSIAGTVPQVVCNIEPFFVCHTCLYRLNNSSGTLPRLLSSRVR